MGSQYPHLSLEERRKIAKWCGAKMPVPEIADRLARAPSTIYRELKRNFYRDDPYAPWQKGTVENTNRRARRWLPRKRDIRSMTDQDIKEISDRLNNTPRKCLDWKTPAEVFREKMLEEMR